MSGGGLDFQILEYPYNYGRCYHTLPAIPVGPDYKCHEGHWLLKGEMLSFLVSVIILHHLSDGCEILLLIRD